MNASAQLQMFEPEAAKLVELVTLYSRNARHGEKVASNLAFAGFHSAAASCLQQAQQASENAAVCEMALQFERLAGLS